MTGRRSFLNREFLDPPCTPDNMAFHSVRTALLSAMRDVSPLFNGRLLDLACGMMPYRELIMAHGNVSAYVGMDIRSEVTSDSEPDLIWDGLTIPAAAGSFDCVLMTEFLEHYPEPEAVIREVHRVLRPGGFVFATVPFVWNLHELPYDEYRYTPFSLERHFKAAGFGVSEIKALGGWNRSLAQMLGLWVRFSGLSRGRRRVFKRLFFPFYRWLIRTDRPPTAFDGGENSMFSGLSILARKESAAS